LLHRAHNARPTTQARNVTLAFSRLRGLVSQALVEPKVRAVSAEPPAHVKRRRRREKEKHSEKKATRRRPSGDF
jgi:hypothetical protein